MASFCEDTCRVDTSVILDPGLCLYIHQVYDYVDDDDHHRLMTWMDLLITTAPLPSICNPSYLDLHVCRLMGDDQSSAFRDSRCCEKRKEGGIHHDGYHLVIYAVFLAKLEILICEVAVALNCESPSSVGRPKSSTLLSAA